MYLVERGLLREYRLDADGRDLTLRFVGPGRLAGGVEALTGRTCARHAEARRPSVVWEIPAETFLQMAGATPLACCWLFGDLADQVDALERLAEGLALRSVRARLASRLLDLAAEHGAWDGSGVQLELPLSQRDLASLAGTTRQSVSQELSWLRRRGIVTGQRARGLRILDPAALRRVAESGEGAAA